jgi:hypothetical protein
VRCATVVRIRRVPPPPKSPPYSIPEIQFFQIANAALWLCPADRDQFWSTIANELQQLTEPGEGVVCRVIASAFLRLFRGFDVPDEPNLLGKLDHGRRFEAKLDAIDAHRTRRERSDAR